MKEEIKDCCAICLDDIHNDQSKNITTECQHIFHKHCMVQWDDHRVKEDKPLLCPLCNFELQHMNKVPQAAMVIIVDFEHPNPETRKCVYLKPISFSVVIILIITASIMYWVDPLN